MVLKILQEKCQEDASAWDGLNRQSEEIERKVVVDRTDKGEKGIVGGERTMWERHRSGRRMFCMGRNCEKGS